MHIAAITYPFALAILFGSTAAHASELPAPAKVSTNGYINVWQLRRDVAQVEALVASEDTDGCFREGDPAEVTSKAQLPKDARDERECIEKIRLTFARYMTARTAFNHVWLPLILTAVRKGDVVAEVILLNCDTTFALDRSKVNSTCEASADRKAAAKRLKEIGFAPAYDWPSEPGARAMLASEKPSSVAKKHALILRAISEGVFDIGFTDLNSPTDIGNSARSEIERDDMRNAALVEAALQDARRVFSFWSSNPYLPAYRGIALNRVPQRPLTLSWGPAVFSRDGIYTGPHYWRSSPAAAYWQHLLFIFGTPIQKFEKPDDVIDASAPNAKLPVDYWRIDANFGRDLKALLATSEQNIDRYLKQDPRWGVFLLHRIGHHEFVPEGMQSDSGKLDSAWHGVWTLQKHFIDWAPAAITPEGSATISIDGESARISIETRSFLGTTVDRFGRAYEKTKKNFTKQSTYPGQHINPMEDVKDCQLHYSGGNFPGAGFETLTDEARTNGGYATAVGSMRDRTAAIPVDAYAPLNPRKSYKQVLMQCSGGENESSDVVRFLLLSENTLLEFALEGPHGHRLHLRHYTRASPAR